MASSEAIYYRSSSYAVEGMTCNSCVMAIKGQVEEVGGTRLFSIDVSLDEKWARAKHADDLPSSKICETIEDAGFDCTIVSDVRRRMIWSRFDVVGMTCSSCVKSIQMALSENGGVLSSDVSLEQNKAIVAHDLSLPRDVVGDIISDAGFDVTPIEEPEKELSIRT